MKPESSEARLADPVVGHKKVARKNAPDARKQILQYGSAFTARHLANPSLPYRWQFIQELPNFRCFLVPV